VPDLPALSLAPACRPHEPESRSVERPQPFRKDRLPPGSGSSSRCISRLTPRPVGPQSGRPGVVKTGAALALMASLGSSLVASPAVIAEAAAKPGRCQNRSPLRRQSQ
jgi:hypothetical protein